MFWKTWTQVLRGKTLMRAFMNTALTRFTLESGKVVDLGGGRNPSYLQFIQGASGATIENIDTQYGEGKAREIDFEKDPLPYADNSVDQALMLNVLEHIYNHNFFMSEAFRILKPKERIIGFVPFLINYHADPHDYFRYTDEALKKICSNAGFSEVVVEPLGKGPFTVNCNTLASFLPRIFIVLLWPCSYILDSILIAVKPSMKKRFPLGYLFILTK